MDGKRRIEEYALIGDLRTAALVRRNGSVDWFCAPRFDSGASFAGLLGTEANGYWKIAPLARGATVTRRYRDGTLILETRFDCVDGAITLIDFMPLGTERPAIVRIVRGESGSVPCEMELTPRMNYGQLPPWTTVTGDAWTAVLAPDALCLRTPVARSDGDGSTAAYFNVNAGDVLPFALEWFVPHAPPPPPIDATAALEATERFWLEWSAHLSYTGPWRAEVLRSAITLKALTYGHTGAIVAAPTTSLPEEPGGTKNWDYRFCWLRDSAYAIDALLQAGFIAEARDWRDWFLRVYAGRAPYLHIMYGIGGERLESERNAPWLPGYNGAAPVRIANDAHDQFQLGVYGDVISALNFCYKNGVGFSEEHWRMVEPLLGYVESSWRTPGNGIWETRDSGRQYVDSKVMAWVALDRALALARGCGYHSEAQRWEGLKETIREEVLRAGFDPLRNTFTQYYGSKEIDAATLLIPITGFLPGDDPRVLGTIAAIERELTVDGFVFRYGEDMLTGSNGERFENEGAFVLCSYWLAMSYALAGRREDAVAMFERLRGIANDVGLLAEEYDVTRKMQTGNFPQAFSHVGQIWTASLLGPTPIA